MSATAALMPREAIYAEFRSLEFRHGPVENARRRELWRMLERLDRNGERPALTAPCEPPTGPRKRDNGVTLTQTPPNGTATLSRRLCLACGTDRADRRSHAHTCSPACRQALRRGQLAFDLEEAPAA